tara:strand:+ start:538 stop:1215 length:678 start_codon:yes stop_codon:yes gene_type:complete
MPRLIDKKNKIIIYLLFLFILSTTNIKFVTNQTNYSSIINKINIKGLSNMDNKKIFNQLNDLFYKNILLVDREEIQSVISKYNIVEEYSIKKIYPSTININIIPTKLIARLSSNDELLVGVNGKFIKDKKNNDVLPYIFGEFSSDDFLLLQTNIKQSQFSFSDFKTLYFFPSKRWDVLTNDNILIKLPQNNLLKSINLAYNIINNSEFRYKEYIDLRVNNHLIIK